MLRNRWRLIFMGLISILFVAGIFSTAVLALEGKAGEVIKTVEELKELEAKGLLHSGQVIIYGMTIKHLGRSIAITETTDCSLESIATDRYRKHSQMNKGKTSIDPKGVLLNYSGQGLPFPDLKPNDPQAGIKVAWNYEYKHQGDDRNGGWTGWLTDSKRYIKYNEGTAKLVCFDGRIDLDPRPNLLGKNRGRIKSKEIIAFTKPFSSNGLAQLSVKYIDVARDKDLWVYVPGLRRITRIGGGNRCDSLGGFLHNLDDQTGWDGNPLLFNWRSLGLKEMLLPSITQFDKPFPYVPKAQTIPVTLERRAVWVIEQTPKDPDYCYSKRMMYFDSQMQWCLSSDCYDRSGNLWKSIEQTYGLIPNPKSAGGGYIVYTNAGNIMDFKILEAGPYNLSIVGVNMGLKGDAFTLDVIRKMGR